MKKTRNKFVFHNFKIDNPYLEDKVTDWWDSGPLEITVVLNDGRKLVYDDLFEETRDYDKDVNEMTDKQYSVYFGRNLFRRMRLRGYTQKRLSEETGIPSPTLGRYLNGTTSPTLIGLKKIAKVLECTISDLTEI